MHLKVFVKLKKTLKTLSSGQKNPKKPTGLVFFFIKNPGFFQPCSLYKKMPSYKVHEQLVFHVPVKGVPQQV
jgi:hypothetical protein